MRFIVSISVEKYPPSSVGYRPQLNKVNPFSAPFSQLKSIGVIACFQNIAVVGD